MSDHKQIRLSIYIYNATL